VLSELFAPDATYSTAPFEEPYRGLEAIGELWEAEREGPDEVFTMESEIVAVEGDTGVVRVEVRYGDPLRQLYRDLWIVHLDEAGRCLAFEGVALLAPARFARPARLSPLWRGRVDRRAAARLARLGQTSVWHQ
jgi:hypothetical protein